MRVVRGTVEFENANLFRSIDLEPDCLGSVLKHKLLAV